MRHIRDIKKTFCHAEIDVSNICDIPFIGKTAWAILCKGENCVIMADAINTSKSDA